MKKTQLNKIETALKNKSISFDSYQDTEWFIESLKRYCNAAKERRLICNIESVSKSGMSRNMRFVELQKNKTTKNYDMLNFWGLFAALKYTKVSNSDCFRIQGCGMDMVFATHYEIIHTAYYYEVINKNTCDKLSQMTPHTI